MVTRFPMSSRSDHTFPRRYYQPYGAEEPDTICLDHCYAKPWSAHPDASNAKPIKYLYMKKYARSKVTDTVDADAEIDVDVVGDEKPPCYDVNKATIQMQEVERQINIIKKDEPTDDWDDSVSRTGWTFQQNRLFSKVIKALQSDRLARLAYTSCQTQVDFSHVKRRIHIAITAKRIRQALACVAWATKLTQWLHGILLDNLNSTLLTAYIDSLQVLRSKIPHLIDKMIAGNKSIDSLGQLLKQNAWDPASLTSIQQKPRKLPNSPAIIVVPPGPSKPSSGIHNKRRKFWNSQLNNIGKVVPINMTLSAIDSRVELAQFLENVIVNVKEKIAEMKANAPGRPIVLMGWDVGSLVACHVSMYEVVSAVICLGFPFSGLNGGRGDIDDSLLESRVPIMFVMGQHMTKCGLDDIEEVREKLKVENSLVLVGGADDDLRVSRSKKKQERITQLMVDRKILDEIADFLTVMLSQPPPSLPLLPNIGPADWETQRKKKRKKYGDDVTDSSSSAVSYGDVGDIHSPSPVPRSYIRIQKGAIRQISAPGDLQQSPQSTRDSNTVTRQLTSKYFAKRKAPAGGHGNCSAAKRKIVQTTLLAGPASLSGATIYTTSDGTVSLAKKTADSIANAPELSGLLQGNKYSRARSLPGSGSITPTSLQPSVNPLSVSANLAGMSLLQTAANMAKISQEKSANSGDVIPIKMNEVPKPVQPRPPGTITVPQPVQPRAPGTITVPQPVQPRAPGTITVPLRSLQGHPATLQALQKLGIRMPTVHVTTATSASQQIHNLLTTAVKHSHPQVTSVVTSAQVLQTSALEQKAETPSTNEVPVTQAVTMLPTEVSTIEPHTISTCSQENVTEPPLVTTSAPSNDNIDSALSVTDQEKVQTIQKLQFHDFPLTTATLSRMSGTTQVTQAKILANSQLDLGKLQALTESKITTFQISKTTVSSELSRSMITSPSTSVSESSQSRSHLASSIIPISVRNYTTAKMPATTIVSNETLGKVSSLLESSPVTLGEPRSAPTITSLPIVTSVAASSSSKSADSQTTVPHSRIRSLSTSSMSYSSNVKPVLSNVSATRTRKIKTPKQYDL